MIANNITANIRMVVRMMSLANPTIQLITDGGVQLTVKMVGWDEKERRIRPISVFSDGIRIVNGVMTFVGLKISDDQINVQEIDYENNTLVVDGVSVSSKDVKDFLSDYSRKSVMELFAEYFDVMGSPSFEMKQIIDPEQLAFEGGTNNCFMGSTNENTIIKRRGSSFGKKRIVKVVDGCLKVVDSEPVRDMFVDILRDGIITIQKPHIETMILKLKRSCERGYKNSNVGDTIYKVVSVKPQLAAIDLSNETYWNAFNNAKMDISDKCILGVDALAVDFTNKTELVVDITKMNILANQITNNCENGQIYTKKDALKVLNVNYAKLAKHKPYLEYVKAYLDLIAEVDKLNKYERSEPRDKKLNKMIFKAVSEIK
jgi:ribosomal protein L24